MHDIQVLPNDCAVLGHAVLCVLQSCVGDKTKESCSSFMTVTRVPNTSRT